VRLAGAGRRGLAAIRFALAFSTHRDTSRMSDDDLSSKNAPAEPPVPTGGSERLLNWA